MYDGVRVQTSICYQRHVANRDPCLDIVDIGWIYKIRTCSLSTLFSINIICIVGEKHWRVTLYTLFSKDHMVHVHPHMGEARLPSSYMVYLLSTHPPSRQLCLFFFVRLGVIGSRKRVDRTQFREDFYS